MRNSKRSLHERSDMRVQPMAGIEHHPDLPHARLLEHAVDLVRPGGLRQNLVFLFRP
jgi:hypothetical protein